MGRIGSFDISGEDFIPYYGSSLAAKRFISSDFEGSDIAQFMVSIAVGTAVEYSIYRLFQLDPYANPFTFAEWHSATMGTAARFGARAAMSPVGSAVVLVAATHYATKPSADISYGPYGSVSVMPKLGYF